MPKDDISFKDLEKQVAKDVLEDALKKLHDEITREISKNKKAFSEEISKTLSSFRQNLEQSVVQEIDQKISALFTKHFSDTSSQVKSSFDQMFSPVLQKTEEDIKRLQAQGENTLNSWKSMMTQYTSLWTKPFFLMLVASVLTGTMFSLLSSYYLVREAQAGRKVCYSTLQWYTEKYFERKKAEETSAKQKANNQTKSKKKSK
jgi:hypothetical protein